MSAAAAGDDYALIVGVKEYADPNTYASMRGAPNDCRDFERWLVKEARVPRANIQSVVWSPKERMPYPGYGDINLALSHILKPEGKDDVPGGRRLYLFSSGHCEASESLQADVITAEARFPNVASYPITKVADIVRRKKLFREIVMFVDGCRTLSNGDSLPIRLDLPSGSHDTQVLYAFACEYDRSAYERKFGGVYRGIFSFALLEGLRGEALTRKRQITSDSLELFLRRRVAELRENGQDQMPEIHCPKSLVLC